MTAPPTWVRLVSSKASSSVAPTICTEPAIFLRLVRVLWAVTVTPIEDLRMSPTAALFEGREEAPVSIFVTEYSRGQGPDLHLHPYPEVFVVQTGTATFTAGEEQLTVAAGNVVVACDVHRLPRNVHVT